MHQSIREKIIQLTGYIHWFHALTNSIKIKNKEKFSCYYSTHVLEIREMI